MGRRTDKDAAVGEFEGRGHCGIGAEHDYYIMNIVQNKRNICDALTSKLAALRSVRPLGVARRGWRRREPLGMPWGGPDNLQRDCENQARVSRKRIPVGMNRKRGDEGGSHGHVGRAAPLLVAVREKHERVRDHWFPTRRPRGRSRRRRPSVAVTRTAPPAGAPGGPAPATWTA